MRSRTERPEPAWLAPSPRLAAWGFGAKPRSFRPEATLSVRAIPPAEARTERAGRFQFSFARRHHKAQAEQLIPTRAELPILANATPASFLSLAANQSSPFGSHAGKSGTNSTLITVKAVAAIHPSYTTLFLWIVLARPRSHKRGNGVCRGTRRRRRRSFNGAALSRARKLPFCYSLRGNDAILQLRAPVNIGKPLGPQRANLVRCSFIRKHLRAASSHGGFCATSPLARQDFKDQPITLRSRVRPALRTASRVR